MKGGWIVVAIVVATTAIAVVMLLLRDQTVKRGRQARLRRARDHWLKQVSDAQAVKREASRDKSLAGIGRPDPAWANEETSAAYTLVVEAQYRMKRREQELEVARIKQLVRTLINDVRPITNPQERFEKLSDAAKRHYGLKRNKSFVRAIRNAARAHQQDLLTRATAGEPGALYNLAVFTSSLDYRDTAGLTYETPANWDQLVANTYKEPPAWLFRNHPGYAPVEMPLLAAQAIKEKDFVLAKIILAYASQSRQRGWGGSKPKDYLDLIGETRLAEIADLVYEVHTSLGLFQEETSQPEAERETWLAFD